ncbi:LOW QUALITY PROTEIN: hypothetical protein PHMEG_00016565 [Phytophthora megakarya]|uniref:Uncharacterized protein n=1 Tax=Phytophthora megakarya TaxID=4795 RepID=A0A225VYZ9_9STRA|nr:LOW QUALITY PROTEIN: hypothetical protein PHMEG_00016565 [Phytophthora megakarya]
MKQYLLWWSIILESPLLNGVPLRYFQAHPPPRDGCIGQRYMHPHCLVLRYKFTDEERSLIQATKINPSVGFDINYRKLLFCAFAVHTWGSRWSHGRCNGDAPVYVQFRIDNTSAVSWQNKLSSRNTRAQTVIRLLGHWELEFRLRFSATHVAGVENRIADAGSRINSSRTMSVLFDELTKDWSQVNSTVDVAEDLVNHLRARSVATSTFVKYKGALRAWHTWTTRRGIQPALLTCSTVVQLQHITDFILHDVQYGFGSNRPVRGATIACTLHGISHVFQAAGLLFPCNHPQVRMLLKGIYSLDAPVRHKAAVSSQLLEQ